jgi:CubicO group peptidase (beta-lactamase class C family)
MMRSGFYTLTNYLKKYMLKYLVSALALALTFFSSSIAQPTSQKLNELVEAYAKLGKFNGSILVSHKDTILLEKGYGFQDVQTKTPNTAYTIYQIGSVTKQFTSAIILKLVELKKMSLEDKLNKYYPGFPHGDSITIENLLTHTSGIYNYTNDENFMKTEAIKPSNEKNMLALFEHKPLDFPPGTSWSYSNSGYALLGYIIQKVTGIPYEKEVRKYIFSPLKMNSSGFDFTHLSNDNKATGYWALSESNTATAGIVDSSVAYSAGSIYSTIGDLYKWHRGLLRGDIIKKSSLEKSFTPFKNKYGYGWSIDSIYNKRRVSHGGGIFGFISNITLLPEDDICIVVLTNTGNSNFTDMITKVADIIYQKPYTLPQERKSIKVSEEILKKYTGEYSVSPQFTITIVLEDGHLIAKPSGQPQSELFAEKENYFFLKDAEIDVEFTSNEKGEVDKLVIHQKGQNVPAKKVK